MAAKNSNSNTNRPNNFVAFTLRVHENTGAQFKESGEGVFIRVKAFLSQGKDKQTDEYKPSIWFTVKASADAVTGVVAVLNDLTKGDFVTVKGRLAAEGDKGQFLTLWANSAEKFEFEHAAEEAGEIA